MQNWKQSCRPQVNVGPIHLSCTGGACAAVSGELEVCVKLTGQAICSSVNRLPFRVFFSRLAD